MSNYNSLKATIDANIKQNGRQEITGQILNSVLNQMVTTLGAGYQFAGVATIATNPGTPDARVFYIANGKGTYEKFGGINVTEDEVVVLYYDTAWHKVSTGIASDEKLSELDDFVDIMDKASLPLRTRSLIDKTNMSYLYPFIKELYFTILPEDIKWVATPLWMIGDQGHAYPTLAVGADRASAEANRLDSSHRVKMDLLKDVNNLPEGYLVYKITKGTYPENIEGYMVIDDDFAKKWLPLNYNVGNAYYNGVNYPFNLDCCISNPSEIISDILKVKPTPYDISDLPIATRGTTTEYPVIDVPQVFVNVDQSNFASNIQSYASSVLNLLENVYTENIYCKGQGNTIKEIIGNGHKIVVYDKLINKREQGNPTTTHNVFPYPNYDPRSSYYIADEKRLELNASKWFNCELSERVTKADGTDYVAGYVGEVRIKLPSNFDVQEELNKGAFIEFFIWYRSIRAFITKVEAGYLYFNATADYDANSEFSRFNLPFHFRVRNYRSDNIPYYYDNAWYVPKNITRFGKAGHFWYQGYLNSIKMTNLSILAGQISHIKNGIFENCEIEGLASPLKIEYNSLFRRCHFHDCMAGGVSFVGSNGIVEYCTFEHINENSNNDAAILGGASHNWVHHNIIKDFGHCAIRVGASDRANSALVEHNSIYQTQEYFKNALDHVPTDGGAIYVYIYSDKNNYSVIRYNNIHHYNSRGAGRGILCDDGCCYCVIYANCISYITTSYAIDNRYAIPSPSLSGYVPNNGKVIINNVIDRNCRLGLGEQTKDLSSVNIAKGNVRLRGYRDDIVSTYNAGSATAPAILEDDIYIDGFFNSDGQPVIGKYLGINYNPKESGIF